MKPLLSGLMPLGVLCAGLLGQAPVQAFAEPDDELPAPGHASLGWQRDDAEGDSAALAVALPLTQVWYLNASAVRSDSQLDTLADSEPVQATSTRLGVSLEQPGWGGSLSLLRYDDESVLQTDEQQLLLRHRGEQVELGLELAARGHDVTVTLPNRTVSESFDSRGLGLHVSVSNEAGLRGYLGWQQYDYDDAKIFDADFKKLLLLLNQYPNLRQQILRAYSSALAQQNQAQGSLADKNWWLGLDLPIAEHVLTVEHFVSTAELDGSEFSTDSVLLALNLGEQWGLDLTAGINQGEDTDDIRFAGITAHIFW